MPNISKRPQRGQGRDLSNDPVEARRALGAEIRQRRLAAHLTQETLAKKASVTEVYLGKIERGRCDVGLEVLLRIATALQVSAGELLGSPVTLSPRGLEAARLFDRSSPEIQRAILITLHAVASAKGKLKG